MQQCAKIEAFRYKSSKDFRLAQAPAPILLLWVDYNEIHRLQNNGDIVAELRNWYQFGCVHEVVWSVTDERRKVLTQPSKLVDKRTFSIVIVWR